MKDLKLKKLFKNFLAVETKAVDGAPRTLVVKISDPEPDRSNDTVQPNGMNADNFLKNPVVMYGHDYKDLPIAKCIGLKTVDNGILATVEFPEAGVNPKSDIVYQLYKGGFLNAWSIGFMPTDYEENDAGGYNFKTWELFEFSSVPVPDNPRALTIMRGKGIDVDLLLEKKKEEKTAEQIAEEEKAAKEAADAAIEKEKKEGQKVEEKDAEPVIFGELTVKQLSELMAEDTTIEFKQVENKKLAVIKTVKKDINEVVALSYVLDELHYFIRAFQQAGVSQDSIDKLTQALALVMEVTQMQAVIGEKSISLKDMTIKTGRTLSAKHEDLLKSSCGYMSKAVEGVQAVLDSVAEQDGDSGTIVGAGQAGAEVPLTKRLLRQIDASQKQMKEADKNIGLTLRLFKTIKSEHKQEGGE